VLFPLDAIFLQSAYGQGDMSLCKKIEPTKKSSNFAREANFADSEWPNTLLVM